MSEWNSRAPKTIPDEFINKICAQFIRGKPVRYSLPVQGRLQIEGMLPFLCIYRRSPGRCDDGTERLVASEATYLIASSQQRQIPGLTKLVRKTAKTPTAQCNAYLIIEIWSACDSLSESKIGTFDAKAGFRIITSRVRQPTFVIESLQKTLKMIKIFRGLQRLKLSAMSGAHR